MSSTTRRLIHSPSSRVSEFSRQAHVNLQPSCDSSFSWFLGPCPSEILLPHHFHHHFDMTTRVPRRYAYKRRWPPPYLPVSSLEVKPYRVELPNLDFHLAPKAFSRHPCLDGALCQRSTRTIPVLPFCLVRAWLPAPSQPQLDVMEHPNAEFHAETATPGHALAPLTTSLSQAVIRVMHNHASRLQFPNDLSHISLTIPAFIQCCCRVFLCAFSLTHH